MGKKGPLSLPEKKELPEVAIRLLSQLISTPSFSREEDETAALIEKFFRSYGIPVNRHMNNVWVHGKIIESRPTLLLNSHHDTVKPNKGYQLDPFQPLIKGGKIHGLGSNDAGGALVSLAAAFLYYYEKEMPFNLVFAATAEEEISGNNGIEAILPQMPKIDFGIVGEPTRMQLAVAERGLLVIDAMARGRAGHAAREEGENAIYRAMQDIQWISAFRFEKTSDWLGPVKMTVTSVETVNKAHNVIPDQCSFIIDVRINELYTHEEILDIIGKNLQSEIAARSFRLRSTAIAPDHPLVKAGLALGRKAYGSPTCSDKALMPFPVLKMGPGDSARSHIADEFIYLEEINEGIDLYIRLLENLEL